ncbi:hypothetical protein QA601_08005 [Chitinispirillales bacterium ANBcel5]|uniref:thiamine-phosphate pyrophosphorylase n=1 Tax=Cellulosispirillum alkaliphilum TaxID=3039283 RepID=UPI002A50BB92|nr:hypothetical protein [Chitinispirillales bacterium ANBcel5]
MLDANLNRLREALRVIEEFFRFYKDQEDASVEIKSLRHLLPDIEKSLGSGNLLKARDTEKDCFSRECRPEEMKRAVLEDVLRANFKRAQEASRSIEEYSKLTETPEVSETAKKIRFLLYSIEKNVVIGERDG